MKSTGWGGVGHEFHRKWWGWVMLEGGVGWVIKYIIDILWMTEY